MMSPEGFKSRPTRTIGGSSTQRRPVGFHSGEDTVKGGSETRDPKPNERTFGQRMVRSLSNGLADDIFLNRLEW